MSQINTETERSQNGAIVAIELSQNGSASLNVNPSMYECRNVNTVTEICQHIVRMGQELDRMESESLNVNISR